MTQRTYQRLVCDGCGRVVEWEGEEGARWYFVSLSMWLSVRTHIGRRDRSQPRKTAHYSKTGHACSNECFETLLKRLHGGVTNQLLDPVEPT